MVLNQICLVRFEKKQAKMARADWGWKWRVKCCSNRRITLVLCSFNIAVALYVLHSLYTSLYVYPPTTSGDVVRYTEEQIRNMEESIRIRRAAKPEKLVELIKKIAYDFHEVDDAVEISPNLKRWIMSEILSKLKTLDGNASTDIQKEIVENWRQEKLEQVKSSTPGVAEKLMLQPEEAGMLMRALGADWEMVLEEIGFWIPDGAVNKDPHDIPDYDEDYDDPLPGRSLPAECNAELHTDYGGDAVRWGLTYHKESAADCCQACFDQANRARPDEKKCNIWVYCPYESGCHSPDIYMHKYQECWLKYAEKPRVTFKNKYSEPYRHAHPTAPIRVLWASGVISNHFQHSI